MNGPLPIHPIHITYVVKFWPTRKRFPKKSHLSKITFSTLLNYLFSIPVGSLAESAVLRLPRGVIHFSFWAKNLGIITSLRMGHGNNGNNPNWLIEHVVIKNEFTGQAYKFTCGRWLGSNIDDGSTEDSVKDITLFFVKSCGCKEITHF